MMKKILLLIIAFSLIVTMAGCKSQSTITSVNIENEEGLLNTVLGVESLIKIGDGLWYDPLTRIVYLWNGYFYTSHFATTPSPYYAPNGLPYRYNPGTNTFEEIKRDE